MRSSEIDELLGSPARLSIVATVADGGRWTFTALREETGLADGNLYVQTGRLVDAGYLEVEKTRNGARTVTRFSLTGVGRGRLRDHVRALEEVIARGRSGLRLAARKEDAEVADGDGSRVW